MIAFSFFGIFSFCFCIVFIVYNDIYTFLIQQSISKKIEIADFIASVFGKNENLNHKIIEYEILLCIMLFVFVGCMFRVVYLFSKSYDIAFINASIKSLDYRIAKLKHRIK
ncbi:hypothetical protein HK16_13550 [Acetobacter senegalensis]|uniref:Uncharacterized protein n=3 Tax=Acetobacteraceae TaxID=433 RepID=A0A252EI44_9PROT|nr:hypothetical protein CIW82_03950 [Acetobacter tropicalis]OUL65903.1 hypothetical protein HK16_13550 [Acetobacter senegalensis]